MGLGRRLTSKPEQVADPSEEDARSDPPLPALCVALRVEFPLMPILSNKPQKDIENSERNRGRDKSSVPKMKQEEVRRRRHQQQH